MHFIISILKIVNFLILADINKLSIDKIMIFNKVPFGKKALTALLVRKFKPLCIVLLKMCAYAKSSDETKYFHFRLKIKKLLKAYNKAWDEFSNIMQKEFDSEPVYNETCLKVKIKSCSNKKNTNFHNT